MIFPASRLAPAGLCSAKVDSVSCDSPYAGSELSTYVCVAND
ncbi:MAG: hypothetical protein ACI8PT_001420 [Gammaproteobacteria bacterium]|jgi:hypothetical protein